MEWSDTGIIVSQQELLIFLWNFSFNFSQTNKTDIKSHPESVFKLFQSQSVGFNIWFWTFLCSVSFLHCIHFFGLKFCFCIVIISIYFLVILLKLWLKAQWNPSKAFFQWAVDGVFTKFDFCLQFLLSPRKTWLDQLSFKGRWKNEAAGVFWDKSILSEFVSVN